MKVTKTKEWTNPIAFVGINNKGSLVIQDTERKFEINGYDDWDEFVNYTGENDIKFDNGFVASSTIDFPEDTDANDEVLSIVNQVFNQ